MHSRLSIIWGNWDWDHVTTLNTGKSGWIQRLRKKRVHKNFLKTNLLGIRINIDTYCKLEQTWRCFLKKYTLSSSCIFPALRLYIYLYLLLMASLVDRDAQLTGTWILTVIIASRSSLSVNVWSFAKVIMACANISAFPRFLFSPDMKLYRYYSHAKIYHKPLKLYLRRPHYNMDEVKEYT